MSKVVDRSNRMRTDDLESAFAIRRASVTAFFEQWGYRSLLECSWEGACEERCVDDVCECW